MRHRTRIISLLLSVTLLFGVAACTPPESTPPERVLGEVAGFSLPHYNYGNEGDAFSYNADLFYLNEGRISGADPGAIYVSEADICDSYEKNARSRQYQEGNEWKWVEGWSLERFEAEFGTLSEWITEYADYYYMMVTGRLSSVPTTDEAYLKYGIKSSSFAMWRSHDLSNWEVCGKAGNGGALGRTDIDGDWMDNSYSYDWAPEFVRDADTGLYFIFFSASHKDGSSSTTYGPNGHTTGDHHDGLMISCAMSYTPVGPYRLVSSAEYLSFKARKDEYGEVITGSKLIDAPDIDRDKLGLPDAQYREIYDNGGEVIGYKTDDERYFTLNGYEITKSTPVLNAGFYYPRVASDKTKTEFFENKYKTSKLIPGSEIDNCVWPMIDANPVVDDKGNKYLYFSQHSTLISNGNQVWVVAMKDWLTPDWDSLTRIGTPNYVTITQDGSFEGQLGEEAGWSEGSINEGTAVINHDDKWYFTYSPFGYGSRAYSIYVAVADSPFGPFTKLGPSYSPVIGIGEEENDYASGTGHHCFINAGDELFILYHCFWNPVNNGTVGSDFLGRAISADRAYWKYVPELGYDMMFGNGPSYNPQPKPETYTGYVSVGRLAEVTGNGDFGKPEYLSDGMITAQPFSRRFEYGRSGGRLEICYKWDKPVEITALMIYNSGSAHTAFSSVDSILFKLYEKPSWYDYPSYNGYCYVMNLKCDEADYLKNYGVMRKAGAAIAEFNPITITEMTVYISGENKYLFEDEDGVEEYRDVRVSEIYLFGVEA